ncbi:MAG: PD40 domain-containing protein [Chloracidobacterium sp.]|nr:PD40 domain-containing protein [Chloracidobacterium sp.]
MPDDDGEFILGSVLRLFQDDILSPTQASAGNIARLRLYDGPLSSDQIAALDRVAEATGSGDQPILFGSARDGFYEIYSSNVDGTNQRRLTNNQLHDYQAKWSPDGQRIVFSRSIASSSNYRIWIMNADGSGQAPLTNAAGTTYDYWPQWRPDGQKIMFSRCAPATGICDIYSMNPDGSDQAPMPLINTANDEDQGTYSADGSKIAFLCSTGGTSFTNPNICLANADGGGRQTLTSSVSPTTVTGPSFSPDGTKIAYISQSNPNDAFTSEVFVINASGGSPVNITNNAFFEYLPVWSPDGSRFLCGSQRTGVYAEVYTFNSTNGSGPARLTTNSVGEIVSDWRRPVVVPPDPALFDYDGDGKTDFFGVQAVERGVVSAAIDRRISGAAVRGGRRQADAC